MSWEEHRTNLLFKLKSTQQLVHLWGQEMYDAFNQGPYTPKYILAVLPLKPKPGSPNELLVRSNMPVGPVQYEDLFNIMHDVSTPAKIKELTLL